MYKRITLFTMLQDMSANFRNVSKHLLVSKGKNVGRYISCCMSILCLEA